MINNQKAVSIDTAFFIYSFCDILSLKEMRLCSII